MQSERFFFYGLTGTLGVLVLLLAHEYRCVRANVRQLAEIREAYAAYVDVFKRLLDQPDLSEFDDDEFLVVNREQEYLRNSVHDYLRENNLDSLLRRMQQSDLWYSEDEGNDAVLPPRLAKKPVRRQCTRQPSGRRTARMPVHIKRDRLLAWPIDKKLFWLSSPFGPRKKSGGAWGFHTGIDMAALRGTPVKAAAAGTVIEAGRAGGYGNTVVIAHDAKYKTRYAHLQRMDVKVGQKVTTRTQIGLVGDTGFVRKSGKDASHLHFEVCVHNKQVNPLYFLA